MSKVKDTFFGGAEKKAGKAEQRAQQAAGRLSAEQLEKTESQFDPFLGEEAGQSLQAQQALLGLQGVEAQNQAFGALQESPGQRFIRQRQERGLVRNASAIGGLGGGNIRTALQEQAAGFAQQDIQNQFNRLGITSAGEQAVTGRQQQAVTNLANIRGGFGAQQGAALIGAGQAKASGIVGQAAGLRGGITQLAGAGAGFAGGGGAQGALQGFAGV
jgi:hypothetical protein